MSMKIILAIIAFNVVMGMWAKRKKKLQEDAVIVPIMASKGAGLLSKDLKGWTAPRVVVAIPLASLHW